MSIDRDRKDLGGEIVDNQSCIYALCVCLIHIMYALYV